MGRLRVLSGRETCQILEGKGFVAVRQRGSHIVMQKKTGHTTTTVPVPDHAELKTGTLNSIIRQWVFREGSSKPDEDRGPPPLCLYSTPFGGTARARRRGMEVDDAPAVIDRPPDSRANRCAALAYQTRSTA